MVLHGSWRNQQIFYSMFRYFLFWSFNAICFCALLKWSRCNYTDNTTFSARSSREQAQPMPLIMHLNQSAADILIQEANSIYVSNTSFDDLISDNDTHQLFLRYRERKRQERLKEIQHEILFKLGFDQEPNVTSQISEQQRQNLRSTFDKLQEMHDLNSTVIDTE